MIAIAAVAAALVLLVADPRIATISAPSNEDAKIIAADPPAAAPAVPMPITRDPWRGLRLSAPR